ncbi:GIY-YIG nuclease family protein [Variovorax sp. dw_954]|uniref:GIY-YIG nuclease family protein n=1 Tax=Variovorax sp. dw_954 TaxID=2720078 RepID=UPI001BD26C31|nr:GIY-YIG nuclease family protein [Variovorax sp. dw_954]
MWKPAAASTAPLIRAGDTAAGVDWMGLEWSPWRSLDARPSHEGIAVYRLRHPGTTELLYIGETLLLGQRVKSHARTFGGIGHVEISYVKLATDVSKATLLEFENDLIACHYELTGRAPTHQFSNWNARAAPLAHPTAGGSAA